MQDFSQNTALYTNNKYCNAFIWSHMVLSYRYHCVKCDYWLNVKHIILSQSIVH